MQSKTPEFTWKIQIEKNHETAHKTNIFTEEKREPLYTVALNYQRVHTILP